MTNWIISIIALVFSVEFDYSIGSPTELKGPGVCFENETYTITVPTTRLEIHYDVSTELCFRLPPWCVKREKKVIPVNDEERLTQFRVHGRCCPGHYLSIDKKGCNPICSDRCLEGSCTAPHKCRRCEPGYAGPLCDALCPYGFYKISENCSARCACGFRNFECNPVYGCVCKRGYTGTECEIPPIELRYDMTPLVFAVLGIIFLFAAIVGFLMYRSLYYIPPEERIPLSVDFAEA